jgi:hypothetical protein
VGRQPLSYSFNLSLLRLGKAVAGVWLVFRFSASLVSHIEDVRSAAT